MTEGCMLIKCPNKVGMEIPVKDLIGKNLIGYEYPNH